MPASRRALPDNLPPRLLSEDQAAEYVGLSAMTFLKAIEAGAYPGPIDMARFQIKRRLWDRAALDAALDRMSGLAQPLEEDYAAQIRVAIDARKTKVRHRTQKQA